MASQTARALQVGVLGAAGYVGGELLRLLADHPDVESIAAFSSSRPGEPWSSAHPHFLNAARNKKRVFEDEKTLADHPLDVLFLALPHGHAQRRVPELTQDSSATLIDLSADFRIRDSALYRQYYGEHACHDLADSFVYGLADVNGPDLAGVKAIASPGCFATATLLALWPVARFLQLRDAPVCFAATGSTGSGASLKRTTHHPFRAQNLFAYALDGHRHQAEIDEQLRLWTDDPQASCRMLPHSAPIARGIHATLHARLETPCIHPLQLLHECYGASQFVRVVDAPPQLASVQHTNFAHVHAVAREGGHEIVVTACIDNLLKGAAGQAVQAMNLSLELDEARGLTHVGSAQC